MPTKAKGKSRFWRKCRVYFRRTRITIWCITLAVLGALVYLNQIGLPDFLKRPLLARLQEHGVAVEFAELRLHWSRGFVAEHVRFGASSATNNPAVPRLTAREVELNLHLRALLFAKVQVDSLAMRGGKLEWTLPQTNAANRVLSIENMETSLRLLPDDRWLLDDLRGRFGGADFFLSGSLTHASAVRNWDFSGPPSDRHPERLSERLRKLAEIMDRISFHTPPELRLDVNGDARDPGSFDARLSVKASGADTAWGRATQVLLTAQIFPAATNELSRAEISLVAQSATSRWATITNFDAKVRLVTAAAHPELVEAAATLRAGAVETPWATSGNTHLKAAWSHTLTNPVPYAGRVELHTDKVTAWLTRATNVDFTTTWAPALNPPAPDAALGLWTNFLPYQVQWSASIGALRTIAFQADLVSCEGDWTPPHLTLAQLRANLYRGSLATRARLDVVSRLATVEGTSDFEFKYLAPWLPGPAQQELKRYTWATPPHLSGTATVVLPAWTNATPDVTELLPTFQLSGAAALTNCSYQDIHADWVATHFSYSNRVWDVPDFAVGRPEGGLQMSHRGNDATGDFYFRLHSTIDPEAVLPLLDPEVRRGFDLCEFGQPPVVSGELWGRWDDPDRLGFRGRIALTNFTFRGQTTDAIVSGLNYTNLVIACLEPRVWRGTQHLAAAGITADFVTKRTYFTNGFSTLDPLVVVSAIGPPVTEVMSPYHFGQPPVARFHGYTSMGNPHDADVVFEGEGNDFESLHFRATHYTAQVIWKNNLLTVTNVFGDFYGGKAGGWAHFVFPDTDHAQYAFGVNVTNAWLSPLVADVTQRTNNLEGLLTGQLNITNASTETLNSWNGYGQAVLRDGLLWELPIFGVLSRPLDAIMPGVGNSRFTEASGTFGITDGIIRSENLEMRSPAMRLQYRGAVNFDGLIRARVIAEPLRDTPVVGSVVSTILAPVAKLFAYRITGTIKDPKSEPIYIPGPVMALFSPFQSLGGLFTPESAKTNAPPVIK